MRLWPTSGSIWPSGWRTVYDEALPAARFDSVGAGLNTVVTLMRQRSHLPVTPASGLDIVSASRNGAGTIPPSGKRVIDVISGLDRGTTARRYPRAHETARLVLTLIEGALVMDAVGHGGTTDRAVAALARLTEGPPT
jgi:hypothetical protein